MATETETLIRLYDNSSSRGICKACRALIDWYETLAGKQMPMNAGAVPRKSEKHPETGRVVAFFSADDTHWASCPAREQFKR